MALKADPADQALLLDLQALDTKLQQLGHRASTLPELATLAGARRPSARPCSARSPSRPARGRTRRPS